MKTLLYTLTFLFGTGSLQARYLFRQDSPGIGLDFSCAPGPLEEEISTPAGPVQMKGYLCQSEPGEVYMFACNSMQGLVESPATLEAAKNGMTGKLGTKVNGQKYTEENGLTTLGFSFSSGSFRGSERVMFTRGILLQTLYTTAGKANKKGWQRFSRSFNMNGIQ